MPFNFVFFNNYYFINKAYSFKDKRQILPAYIIIEAKKVPEMKRTAFFIMIFLVPFILTACIRSVTPDLLDDPSPRQGIQSSNNGLQMNIEQSNPKRANSNIKIDIINSSDTLFGYGEFFYIEKNVDGDWYMLAFDEDVFSDFSDFDNYGKVISSGAKDEIIINPEAYQLTFDSGEYRIVKAFRYHDDPTVFWLTAEFEVT